MDIIEIPYSPVNLFLFIGHIERDKFNNKVKFQCPDWKNDPDSDAMNFLNHIYIEDITDKEVLLHETMHFLAWLFDYMEITEENEFKACIGSHIINKIIEIEKGFKK